MASLITAVNTTAASSRSSGRRTGPRTPPAESGPPSGDRVDLSPLARRLAAGEAAPSEDLSRSELHLLTELRRMDRKVRSHERLHLAIAGRYARGGISYEFHRGPDGQFYAVAGSVRIDTSEARTPQQTVEKMRVVRRAALAPVNPSPADRAIAAKAAMEEVQARLELQQQRFGAETGTDRAPAGGKIVEREDPGSAGSASDGERTRPENRESGEPGADFYRQVIGLGRHRRPGPPLRLHDILHPDDGFDDLVR